MTVFLEYVHGHCVIQRYSLYKQAFHKACSNIQAFSLCDQDRTNDPTCPRSLMSTILLYDSRFCVPVRMSHKSELNMSYRESLLGLLDSCRNLCWADQLKVLMLCFVLFLWKFTYKNIYALKIAKIKQNNV